MAEKSKSIRVWREDLDGLAPRTRELYTKALDRFLEWAGWTPEELYEIHLEASKSDDPRDRHRVSRRVKTHMRSMIEDGYSTSHASQTYRAVKSFLTSQGFDFRLSGSKPFTVRCEGSKLATKDHVRRLVDAAASLRNKAIVLTARDTGLRISDLVNLTVGQVRPAIYAGRPFLMVEVKQVKTGIVARPIFGPESLEALRRYLEARGGAKDGDPLFVTVRGEKGKMRPTVLSNIFYRLSEKCGFKKLSAHSLRKASQTFLMAGGMPEGFIARLHGRRIQNSSEAYTKPTDEMLLEAYERAYPALACIAASQADEVDRLQSEVEMLQKQVAEFEALMISILPEIKFYRENPEIREAYGKAAEKKARELVKEYI